MNDSYGSKGKFAKFMERNGFYLALAVCVLGAGAAAWVAVSRANNNVTQNQPSPSAAQNANPSSSYGFPTGMERAAEAEKRQENVKVPSSSAPVKKTEAPAAKKTHANSSQPAAPVANHNTAVAKTQPSSFVLPLTGEVYAAFSAGELVKNETLKEWRTHNGVDIKAPQGTDVKSVCDGKVTSVREDPLMGTTVEILHHDDILSVYCGLDKKVDVKEGAQVKVGQVIGTVGEIPIEIKDDAHLHFAMKVNDKWVDPLKVMDMVS